MPLALDDRSEPEPDVAVVGGEVRDYRDEHPRAPYWSWRWRTGLLTFDRGRKLALYARVECPRCGS